MLDLTHRKVNTIVKTLKFNANIFLYHFSGNTLDLYLLTTIKIFIDQVNTRNYNALRINKVLAAGSHLTCII